MATEVDARADRQSVTVTLTHDGRCPGCSCCDQAVCVAAWQETNTTCAAWAEDGAAPGARYGERCPCTTGVTGRF